MNSIESESVRFSRAFARMNRDQQGPLARVRRVDHHQQTLVNWLSSPDESPLELTIGFEQVASEVTAAVAQQEPEPYLARSIAWACSRIAISCIVMLHCSIDSKARTRAMSPNAARTSLRAVARKWSTAIPWMNSCITTRTSAQPITKLNAPTIMAAEHQIRDDYMTVGSILSDPVVRLLYGAIASIAESHVTQYELIIDPGEGWLEKWPRPGATEAYKC